jgi:diguanylate cyclase (GGDEF)-like protein
LTRLPARSAAVVAALRGRLPRLVTAGLGVVLLAVAIASTVTASRAAALLDLDHALTSEATSNASVLKEYFERAESIDLLLAHDSAFGRLQPGRVLPPGRHSGDASVQASEAMAYLTRLYHGRISEACLIDGTGAELARVVRGKVAPASELSTEEAENPFFAPTLRLPKGRVYQAAPYLSDDTNEWVISNSTPLYTDSDRPWAMVHFEVSLDSFRPATVAGRRAGFAASIVDTRTGRILLESGRPLGAASLGRNGAGGLRSLVSRPAALATATVDGQRVAVARVPVPQDNANSWSVAVAAPSDAVGWSRSIGPAPVATALAAMLMLAFAGLNLRAGHRELQAASLTDDLTGLPNRRLLSDRLDQALRLGHRRGTTTAVLLLDLDRFKEVNDTLGHDHGDQLLRGVADRLSKAFRTSDTVARLGGDEFAVLLPEVADEAAALLLATRSLTALHEAFVIEGVTLNVEASIGLALSPQHGRGGHTLMRLADVAMYEAKARKTGVVVYDPEIDVNTHSRLALRSDLRRALQDGELFMDYQPKVNLITGEVNGVEALVRWQHPTRGLLPPAEFIPVAEGTGLILPLTVRTLEMAIEQARAWLDQGRSLQVAVNLSARCLLGLDFPTLVQGLLNLHQLPAHLLRLEITESTIMADPTRAQSILAALQQAGISLSIDDFGTGYSSMSYLKRLPVDELKIDRSFILDMLASSSDSMLVRSSIDLGHGLGLSVVAEGVEDKVTLAALAALNCDLVQGYHLARPMSSAALTDWLDARSDQPQSHHPTPTTGEASADTLREARSR